MTQAAIPQALRKLIQTLRQHPPGSPAALLLASCLPGGMDADALDWLIRRARDEVAAEIVFRYEVYGYVVIGLAGDEHVYVDPGLYGLDLAHEIFTHGINAPATLRAGDAARNALERAAVWVEPRCQQLARAIREISIKDGRPIFSPAHRTSINVF